QSKLVAEKAKKLYEGKLRPALESSDAGRFICSEPESGDYFLGRIFGFPYRFDGLAARAIGH
ncbi:MAG: hypothetical protein WD030_06735, partial [Pirellulales bacterium]